MRDDDIQDGRNVFVLTKPEQLRALGAPATRMVFDGLLKIGKGSIKQVAAAIGKGPHGLYHHFEKLVDVGLVVEAGHRRSGARIEQIFQPISHLLSTDPENDDPEYLLAVADNAATGYRQAERSFRRALLEGKGSLKPEQRNLAALQFTVQLNEHQRGALIDRINGLIEEFTADLDQDEHAPSYLITLGVSPHDN